MVASQEPLMAFLRAIVAKDTTEATGLLIASPALALARTEKGPTKAAAKEPYFKEIEHYVYWGDSTLHMAAAAHRPEIIRLLVSMGAEVAARNRRGAHYAADGVPASPGWDPLAQAEAVTCLIEAGADPHATDKNGATPLHRAVRTRCAAAVVALLDGGADPQRPNKSGSTPMQLAQWTTGRGGSGSPESKAQQEEIVRLLDRCTAGRD